MLLLKPQVIFEKVRSMVPECWNNIKFKDGIPVLDFLFPFDGSIANWHVMLRFEQITVTPASFMGSVVPDLEIVFL